MLTKSLIMKIRYTYLLRVASYIQSQAPVLIQSRFLEKFFSLPRIKRKYSNSSENNFPTETRTSFCERVMEKVKKYIRILRERQKVSV